MNKFKNILKDARQIVKMYLNLFKRGCGGYAAAVDPISFGAQSPMHSSDNP
jgi:hypothetical protein